MIFGLLVAAWLSSCANQETFTYHRKPTFVPKPVPRATAPDEPPLRDEPEDRPVSAKELGKYALLGALAIGFKILTSDDDDKMSRRERILRKKGYIKKGEPSPFRDGVPNQYDGVPAL